jgi:hypothetical protein
MLTEIAQIAGSWKYAFSAEQHGVEVFFQAGSEKSAGL